MDRIRIALVGIGKIARDQHIPALLANERFELVATASPNNHVAGVPSYPTIEALLQAVPAVEAVSICTSPQVRYEIARHALERGKHVMLEKPPGATLNEVAALTELAERRRVALFATWHSREAPGVEPAREWLTDRTIHSVAITWKEDVRVWHPGQKWIWKAGGLGVFDPGINALSILTRILPEPAILEEAELSFPSNCESPIAARLLLRARSAEIRAEFDFRQTGPQSWDIAVQTDAGELVLSHGGGILQIDGLKRVDSPNREYPNLYARFETLARTRNVDVDLAPFRLVADAFLRGRRVEVEPFIE